MTATKRTYRRPFGSFGALRSLAAVLAIGLLTGCGGGRGGGPPSMMPPSGGDGSQMPDGDVLSGSNAAFTVSADGDIFGSLPVTVSTDAITVGNQTISFDLVSQVGGRVGHYRAYDSAGATSGPATEVHYFGQDDGYSYIQFGSWAKGVVSPNPGFRIGQDFGAFVAPYADTGLTPVSNLPAAGTATWQGQYTGYVDKEGVGVSHVVGGAQILASFGSSIFGVSAMGGDGDILLTLSPPDPNRSSFAVPPQDNCAIVCVSANYADAVEITGLIEGNTFEGDVTATRNIAGQAYPRGDSIRVFNSGFALTPGGVPPSPVGLYSHGRANSGGMRGGFFGNRGGESGGTYYFTIGTTKAAGSFGGKLQ